MIALRDFAAKRRFIEMRAEGKSYSEIAKELKISKGTCSAWNKELESEVSHLKGEQIRELYDQYYLMRSDRIAALAKKVKKLEDEIDNRPVSDIPTENLWRLYRQFYGMLKDEIMELKTERWEQSLAALTMDQEPEDQLLKYGPVFLKKDREEQVRSLGIISGAMKRFEKGPDLSEKERIQYRNALNKLNTLYGKYQIRFRFPLVLGIMPSLDQRILSMVAKALANFERALNSKSLSIPGESKDKYASHYLGIVSSATELFGKYGMTMDNLKICFDGIPEWIREAFKVESEDADTSLAQLKARDSSKAE